MSKEIILDLGCGGGGGYMDHDPKNRLRIGADQRPTRLAKAVKNYPIEGVVLNVCDGTLPFASDSLDGLDIIMPHNELLIHLTDTSSGLWEEMHRVIRTSSSVNVLFDVQVMSGNNFREIKTKTGISILVQPQQNMVIAAQHAGFDTISTPVTSRELRMVNTRYSNSRAKRIEEIGDTLAFRVTATKKL